MKRSLRTKILLLVTGTIAVLAALVAAATTVLARRELDRQVRADVRATGVVLTQLLRERGASLQQQSRLLARQPALKAYIQSRDRATLRDIAEDFRRQLRADETALTDRDGQALGGPPADRSGEPGVAAALDGDAWSGVQVRRGRVMLTVSVPIVIGPEVWGTLTADSALDDTLAHELKDTLSGSDVAFTQAGQVVGASRALPARLAAPADAPRVLPVAGRHFYALYAPLPNTDARAGLGFVVLRPAEAAWAISRRFESAFILVCALILPMALGAGILVARSIIRPLDGVVQAARVVRAGGWPDLFPAGRQDEIGLLQTAFNEMTGALRQSRERLLSLIDADPLTGLDNHRRFQERLAQEARRCAASGEPLALLLFDLDHFQAFNQQHGHAAGDARLMQFGNLLSEAMPPLAVSARYGGEEFAVLLPRHTANAAERIGEDMRGVMAECWQIEGLTVSVGCAALSEAAGAGDELALAAELAVSQAKQLGRNRVCRFDALSAMGGPGDPGRLARFLKDGSLAAIQALAAAVDAKDPYTHGHSERVAQLAADLAAALGLPPADVELVHVTGTLHDVGKIGVPDAILGKPGRLDETERAVIETHPALGEVIVRKVPALAATLPGVRHHHERWDGRGYPDGLAGDKIPLTARLLALADTFDAMTSDRPYRRGLSWEAAQAEITRGTGTQFDPALAPAFVQMLHTRQERTEAA